MVPRGQQRMAGAPTNRMSNTVQHSRQQQQNQMGQAPTAVPQFVYMQPIRVNYSNYTNFHENKQVSLAGSTGFNGLSRHSTNVIPFVYRIWTFHMPTTKGRAITCRCHMCNSRDRAPEIHNIYVSVWHCFAWNGVVCLRGSVQILRKPCITFQFQVLVPAAHRFPLISKALIK